jgi:hypothetical protein
VRRPRRRQATAVLPDAGGSIPGSPAVARLFCPGCQQQHEIDLRRIVRPRDFPIMALRAALVCETMCRGGGPPPQLLERTAEDER